MSTRRTVLALVASSLALACGPAPSTVVTSTNLAGGQLMGKPHQVELDTKSVVEVDGVKTETQSLTVAYHEPGKLRTETFNVEANGKRLVEEATFDGTTLQLINHDAPPPIIMPTTPPPTPLPNPPRPGRVIEINFSGLDAARRDKAVQRLVGGTEIWDTYVNNSNATLTDGGANWILRSTGPQNDADYGQVSFVYFVDKATNYVTRVEQTIKHDDQGKTVTQSNTTTVTRTSPASFPAGTFDLRPRPPGYAFEDKTAETNGRNIQ